MQFPAHVQSVSARSLWGVDKAFARFRKDLACKRHVARLAAGNPLVLRRAASSTSRVARQASSEVAVITGAGSGIGRALTAALALKGLRVLAVGRRKDALAATKERVRIMGGSAEREVQTLSADVSKEEGRRQVAECVGTMVTDGTNLTCLVHNAAVIGELGDPLEVTEAGFQAAMATNVEAPLFLTKALATHLAKAPHGGRVLQISSGAAYTALPGCLTYCTSKAALLHVMRCLDADLSEKGIRVASVMPGVVNTEMQEALRSKEFASVGYFQTLAARTRDTAETPWPGPRSPPRGELDMPENVADFLTWLLQEVPLDEYGGREWDINADSDQSRWLRARA
eukprot:TRINITY_DN41400_c0_g1_i1.p1 TRINITY_DN41400_c0_g1~~TRINITY_DN41400_c0_g1_i1.p1  ORF type:complete len:370 (-),score=45.09 TRINITY_DN41400_c0_g1_i1:57-1082(-)